MDEYKPMDNEVLRATISRCSSDIIVRNIVGVAQATFALWGYLNGNWLLVALAGSFCIHDAYKAGLSHKLKKDAEMVLKYQLNETNEKD